MLDKMRHAALQHRLVLCALRGHTHARARYVYKYKPLDTACGLLHFASTQAHTSASMRISVERRVRDHARVRLRHAGACRLDGGHGNGHAHRRRHHRHHRNGVGRDRNTRADRRMRYTHRARLGASTLAHCRDPTVIGRRAAA